MAELLGTITGKMIKIIRLFFRYIRKHKLIGAIASFSFMLLISLLLFNKADAHESSQEVYYKYFHTITVESGDTLWSIADNTEHVNDNDLFIDEIKNINNIKDDVIYAGDILVVPYYSTDFYK